MSLRLPYVLYVAIGAMLVGVLLAPIFREVEPGVAVAPLVDLTAHHGTHEVDTVGAPQVGLRIERDQIDGWNIAIETANFTFTPDAVGAAHAPGTGHAHMFVNGIKRARIYSPDFHLPELLPGDHEITVSLSTNGHDYYIVNGARIEATETITQTSREGE